MELENPELNDKRVLKAVPVDYKGYLIEYDECVAMGTALYNECMMTGRSWGKTPILGSPTVMATHYDMKIVALDSYYPNMTVIPGRTVRKKDLPQTCDTEIRGINYSLE